MRDFCNVEALPNVVRVSLGYYDGDEETSISVGDEFVFYFLKTVHTIPAKPVESLPSSYSNQFKAQIAVIDKHSISTGKYVYSTPGELMVNRMECPQVVCIISDHYVQSTLLKAGMVCCFLIKCLGRLIARRYCLGNTRENEVHELKMNSGCQLTTRPEDTQIYITEYLDSINKFLKLFRGVMCSDVTPTVNNLAKLLQALIGKNLTLEAPTEQNSIIAKSVLEGTWMNNLITVEIPLNLLIKVVAIECEEEDTKQICSEACNGIFGPP